MRFIFSSPIYCKNAKGGGSAGVGWLVGSLSFDVQGRVGGGSSDPFGQTKKGVQKLDIFLGCHKCMVPNVIYKNPKEVVENGFA